MKGCCTRIFWFVRRRRFQKSVSRRAGIVRATLRDSGLPRPREASKCVGILLWDTFLGFQLTSCGGILAGPEERALVRTRRQNGTWESSHSSRYRQRDEVSGQGVPGRVYRAGWYRAWVLPGSSYWARITRIVRIVNTARMTRIATLRHFVTFCGFRPARAGLSVSLTRSRLARRPTLVENLLEAGIGPG